MTKFFSAALLMILVTVSHPAKAGLLSTTTGIVTNTASTVLSGTTSTTTTTAPTTTTTTDTTTTSTDTAYTPPPGLLTDEFVNSLAVSTDSTLVVSADSTVYQVPEPGTFTLLCIGLTALVATQRHRKGSKTREPGKDL